MDSFPAIATVERIDMDEVLSLYKSVEWVAYTKDPAALSKAITNSTFVLEARTPEGLLVGLLRGLSDDSSILYLQDILVRPAWQRMGVGRALLQECLDRYRHVRQKVLLTDDLPAQHRFYESMGFLNIRDIEGVALHTYVQIEGIGATTAT